MYKSIRSRKIKNMVMLSLLVVFTLVALTPLVSIFIQILVKGASSLSWHLFTELPNPPGEKGGGFGNAFLGTIELVLISSVVGIPVGVLSAVYLNEYGAKSWFASMVRFVVDLLLGVPSIVVGIFAYLAFVVPLGQFSALSGGLALAIMMIPIICRSTEGVLKLVPDTLREASYALGISRWRTIVSIVIPHAMKGIVTGVMLSVARVAGETAPLLLTSFGNLHWNFRLSRPIASMPQLIYQYASSPYDDWIKMAWAAALILIVFVLLLNIAARFITRRR